MERISIEKKMMTGAEGLKQMLKQVFRHIKERENRGEKRHLQLGSWWRWSGKVYHQKQQNETT